MQNRTIEEHHAIQFLRTFCIGREPDHFVDQECINLVMNSMEKQYPEAFAFAMQAGPLVRNWRTGRLQPKLAVLCGGKA
ncbi:hypothetical protein [Mesorhizobium huakuii]|uniref:Uncharacterized protein n=1 Tax=Mesorhizobium huakuii TaxID=28104 RepID=A0A7G6SUP0_9HYPH|nr:hypothetical protein [Mesorhizobium huakuii]QND58222.1 hypothetical protein HB778_17710 [Mesorhizobium huakuii]